MELGGVVFGFLSLPFSRITQNNSTGFDENFFSVASGPKPQLINVWWLKVKGQKAWLFDINPFDRIDAVRSNWYHFVADNPYKNDKMWDYEGQINVFWIYLLIDLTKKCSVDL